MTQTDLRKEDAAGEDIEIGFFRPEDAEGIVALFRSVYGEGYPVRLFYDPAALTAANEAGQYYSLVARTGSATVVAVENLFRSAPCKSLYEIGAGLVLKEYRNQGLTKQLFRFVFEDWVPSQAGIEELWGEPVCNHLHMQRTVGQFKHIEYALEVALMPAAAYEKEKSAPGRVAALSVFRCYKPRPHRVYLPKAYEQELRFLYSAMNDKREILLSEENLPAAMQCRGETTVFDFASVGRVAVHAIGGDFHDYVRELETTTLNKGVSVIQMWLDLGSPCVGAAVDILRKQGYFLGGLLPRWFDSDGFLMQKVLMDPDFDSIQLYSDRSKHIFAMVKEDWLRTQTGTCGKR
ncbi:MAG TPA: hypothetical protein VK463_12780 [Desulfomonilaceae bacterium]|nr:hypothetical protein [Desulfomonilaceae bacterium]